MTDDYPKADEVDICLILEGTYPFLPGGVSNWVYELIRFFPHYRFAAIFLGTRAQDYEKLYYPLPDNLVHLEAHFLFEWPPKELPETRQINQKTMAKVACLHEKMSDLKIPTADPTSLGASVCPWNLASAPGVDPANKSRDVVIGSAVEPTLNTNEKDTFSGLFDLLLGPNALQQNQFLRAKSAWEFMVEQYLLKHADHSFYDYFWSVRNLHYPFWQFKEIVQNIPKSRVIHSASTGYAGFLGAFIHHVYQTPHILTEHGIYTKERWIDLMRNYFFDTVMATNKPVDIQQDLVNIWIKFFNFLAKVAYDSAYPIISLFEAYRERQIQDGASRERTRIISYGIDCQHYHFLGKQKPNATHPIIACIGRVVAIKDIKTFIRGCALIIQKKPTTECWIVGSMKEDPEYAQSCQIMVKILGLENQIKFLGPQNIMEIYPKLDLLLLTSISEGSPFVMLECLAVGIPVVATDVGECSGLIYGKSPEDKALGAAGHIVKLGDAHHLAEAALSLLDDEVAWSKAQQAGVKRIQTFYSMALLVQNYGKIYQEVMDSE